MLLAFDKVTGVARLVWERLVALAMLLVVGPFALVEAPIRILTDALSMQLVVLPLALVNDTIMVHESSLTVAFASFPVAEVVRLVQAKTEAKPFLLLSYHLTNIDRSILGGYDWMALFRGIQELPDLRRQVFVFKDLLRARLVEESLNVVASLP